MGTTPTAQCMDRVLAAAGKPGISSSMSFLIFAVSAFVCFSIEWCGGLSCSYLARELSKREMNTGSGIYTAPTTGTFRQRRGHASMGDISFLHGHIQNLGGAS